MSRSAQFGRNLLLALILSVFVLPVANAGLVEIYINKSDELTESETEFVIESGKDINLEIRLAGALRIDSDDKNLSVESIYIDVYFDSDTDRRESTSGIPQYQAYDGLDPGYDSYTSKFLGDDSRFEGYEGPIRISIILKNSSNEIIPGGDRVIMITMDAPAKEESVTSGFSLPALPDEIADNLILILGGFVGLVVLSLLVYQFVLAPEDTTADIYRQKESIDPLKKSLTGVGYESELPSESKLNRLENRDKDSDEEEEDDDDEEYEYDDDDDDDDEFDERAMLDKLTGTQRLDDANETDDDEEKPAPAKKKAVKKKVTKKTVAKKKVVKKAAPVKKKASEPEVNMGKGVASVTCPSCEKVHHIEENTTKFICSCGRRIRV